MSLRHPVSWKALPRLTHVRCSPHRTSSSSLPPPPPPGGGHIHIRASDTGWRRCIGCLNLQISFRKRAIHDRALMWKMTYKEKASDASAPPSTHIWSYISLSAKEPLMIGLLCGKWHKASDASAPPCTHIWLGRICTGAPASDPCGELAHIKLSHVYIGAHILLRNVYDWVIYIQERQRSTHVASWHT